MSIRKDASHLSFFVYLVGRSVTPTLAGQAEVASILKSNLCFFAFDTILNQKQIYIFP
ncbi:hypothetical protein [Algoriphagus winogradskyi]|uniref:Uncharacterized protein n=1 Tax=Algoriphagus winogradskyi TaxID=237017 RepID=A0ABY1NFY3_9BACT|nr:hypothetical protein [Algoriphagus winogradskyi]SMP08526.1 hypothetical protein SAMN06265367_101752 [Algoriphagus winogradskyi]